MAQVLTRERVEEFYAVYSRHDFDRISDFLHDDVMWSVSGPVDLLTFCGVRNSKADVIRMLKTVVPSIFRSRRFDVEQILIEGDRAAVLAKLSGEKLDGRVMNFNIAHFSTFRDGKVARLQSVIDSFNAVEQTFNVHLDVGDKRAAKQFQDNDNVVAL